MEVFQPTMIQHVNFQLGHIAFLQLPAMFVMVLVLLVIGFVFKSLFKFIIYLIAFVFLVVVGLKVIGFLWSILFMY
ncbi:hypothetical protein [Saccharicrinis fermentans]|uniref:Uncharacterized protein n=1 Tax=Saccharicrinis fermentans DSM 9555 = JCM 21142 TaxID=869213 RepID=W7Y5I8_9BACT|nr:hypothetical protein [Saccharicrinis fermentans]GAF02833.1 hypothetical protein JCM21142_41478 [Saccharicrinis fermentans DSM 9555 = JCM 21142]